MDDVVLEDRGVGKGKARGASLFQTKGNLQRTKTLAVFNENMGLLALNAAHIFKIFSAMAVESEYMSGEMSAVKGML